MLKLQDRDIKIIKALFNHKFLTTGQIQRLCFPGLQLQTAQKRMSKLHDVRYTDYIILQEIPQYIHKLGKRGAEYLNINYRNRQIRSSKFFKHLKELNDFRISLTLACNQHSYINLKMFEGEYNCNLDLKDTVFLNSEIITHQPDGMFCLENNNKYSLFFVEIDRSSETSNQYNKHLRFYLRYLDSDKFKRYNEIFFVKFYSFRTLFVVKSEQRMYNMIETLESIDVPYDILKNFIWFKVKDSVNENTFFQNWISVNQERYEIK